MHGASVTKPAKLRGVYYLSYDTFASHSGTTARQTINNAKLIAKP